MGRLYELYPIFLKEKGWDGIVRSAWLAGVHKIFFVWYPKFFPKNLSYETRNYYYQKMRQKSRYKMVLYIIFVAALPQIVHSVSKMVIGNGVLVLRDNYEHTN